MTLGFVHIEKTAGTSTHRIFQRSFGAGYCIAERFRFDDELFRAADQRRLRWIYPRLRGLGGHWVRPYSDLREAIPDLRYLTFLRDPLVRCASHYQHQIQRMDRKDRFEDWIQNERYRNFQTRRLVGREDAAAAIRLLDEEFLFVGLAERFEESLVMLRRLIGEDVLHIEHRAENVASDSSLKKALLADPEQRRLLEDANRVDQEVYDWVVRELYPRQQAAYGPGLAADVERFRQTNRLPRFDVRQRWADLHRYLLYKPLLLLNRKLAARSAS